MGKIYFDLNVIQDEHYSFFTYTKEIDGYIERNRKEVAYTDTIINFLRKIFANNYITVDDVSTHNKSNENKYKHTIKPYCGELGSPDLLIAKNMIWSNIGQRAKEIEYLATVEIKTPYVEYTSDKNKKQLISHLNADEINRVIFTNCFSWHFFDEGSTCSKGDLKPIKSYNFKKTNGEWVSNRKKPDEFIAELLTSDEYLECEPDEWLSLIMYLKEFVLGSEQAD